MLDINGLFNLVLACFFLSPGIGLGALTYYYHQEMTNISEKPSSPYWENVDIDDVYAPAPIN